MEIRRVSDVRAYIKGKYPKLNDKKYDIVKIGARSYIYFVDRENNLQREMVFQGNLPMINELPVLMKQFEATIRSIMQKWNYC
jgi:hypothetical protein